MNRGDVYRWRRTGPDDPRRSRPVVVVSRHELLAVTAHSTVICAPIFTSYGGLATQVLVGTESGLTAPSSIHCDNLMSIHRDDLRDYVGSLSAALTTELDRALAIALGINYIADAPR